MTKSKLRLCAVAAVLLLTAGLDLSGTEYQPGGEKSRSHRDIAPCAVAHYSFGTAVTSGGAVLFTEFNRRKIRSWDPKTGRVEVWRGEETPGMYGLAASPGGDVFVGLDLGDRGDPGKVLRIAADGEEEYVVENITRPRQLTCDGAGNLFVVLEGGRILRWDRIARTVTEIMTAQPPVSGVAVGVDGSLYVSEYGTFDAAPDGYAHPSVPGQVKVRRPNGEISVLAKGFWRARGLALCGGNLYLCTESNREDQGNGGRLLRIDTATGDHEILLDRLDYPQFPAVCDDGKVYFTLARDDRLVAYDPDATFGKVACPVDDVASMTARGGSVTWTGDAAGIPFSVESEAVRIEGFLRPNPGSPHVDGWIEIPADRFQLDTSDRYFRRDRDHPIPGVFELPKVDSQCGSGGILVEVFPVRRHQQSRWPMQNVGTAEESPAPGFGEQPEAFRFYYCWSAGE